MRKSKLILFLLIVCLALTLCVPALAADTPANYSAGGEAGISGRVVVVVVITILG